MLANNDGRVILLGIILMVACASVNAQQTVFRWVDEDGVVHFSDAPPDESAAVESETITTEKPPPYVAPLNLSSNRLRLLNWIAKSNRCNRKSTGLR